MPIEQPEYRRQATDGPLRRAGRRRCEMSLLAPEFQWQVRPLLVTVCKQILSFQQTLIDDGSQVSHDKLFIFCPHFISGVGSLDLVR